MKQYLRNKRRGLWPALVAVLLLVTGMQQQAGAQRALNVNLAALDGTELTPANILNYQILSTLPGTTAVLVKGKVTYRATGLSFSYSFHYTLQPGMNQIDAAAAHPQWSFSSSALRELFMDYGKLPTGTYEYCVEVVQTGVGGEQTGNNGNRECMYQKVNDIFLINLVDPDNNAKLHEYYPVLSWMVNYPFASALTYRLRVAAIKEGQNNTAAINRNNPVYQESNIGQTSLSYPVYGKALEPYQPYAWTVDAYYKGILLGGAEPWRFTIVEDSVVTPLPKHPSYYDFKNHYGEVYIYAIGDMKLKYINGDFDNTLKVQVMIGEELKEIETITLKEGDNRIDVNLRSKGLGHLKKYKMIVTEKNNSQYIIPFIYANPELIQ